MPCPSPTECYARQPLYEGGIIRYKGKAYYVASLERIWPQSWNCEDSTSSYPFEYDSAYYAPNNYLFAYYPIPQTFRDSCAWKEKDFHGIEPELLGGRLARFYGSALGAGRHLVAQYLFTDSIRKRIYIAMKTEDSVRLYDYSGSLIHKIGGNRGKGQILNGCRYFISGPIGYKNNKSKQLEKDNRVYE
jgi:hypothetical protein